MIAKKLKKRHVIYFTYKSDERIGNSITDVYIASITKSMSLEEVMKIEGFARHPTEGAATNLFV